MSRLVLTAAPFDSALHRFRVAVHDPPHCGAGLCLDLAVLLLATAAFTAERQHPSTACQQRQQSRQATVTLLEGAIQPQC